MPTQTRLSKPRRSFNSIFATALLGVLIARSPRAEPVVAEVKPFGHIERKDPALDRLVPPNAQVERLADGFDWSEGPVWVKRRRLPALLRRPAEHRLPLEGGRGDQRLPQAQRLHRRRPPAAASPAPTAWRFDPEGRLVLCQHGDRRVARLREGRQVRDRSPTATRASGSTAPTTLRLQRRTATSTSPTRPTACSSNERRPDEGARLQRRLPRSREGRQLTLLTKEMTFPNGIALLARREDALRRQLRPRRRRSGWPSRSRTTARSAKGRVFFDATPLGRQAEKGLPDGMKVDQAGNLFATGPGGVLVFDPGRQPPRHARHRRGHRQLRLGRRRLDPLHHEQQASSASRPPRRGSCRGRGENDLNG